MSKVFAKSMRDTNQGLAALRHRSAKENKHVVKKEEARKTFAVLIVSIVQNNNIFGENCCSKRKVSFLFCFGKRKQRYSMLYVFTGVALHNSWRFSYFFTKC